jgi:DNA-binding transcriptional LysR family regulator
MSDPAPLPDWPVEVRIHQLEGFFQVATHQGYARAVAAIPYSITEPALHQQVRKLEGALGGVRLLERAPGRRMVLTPAGRSLYRFVAPFYEKLPGLLRTISANLAATLLVATEPFYVEELCAPALHYLMAENPEAQFQLLELDRPHIMKVVMSGRVDIGVAVQTGPVPEGLAFEEIGELGLQLLVPASHPLSKKRAPLKLSQLEGIRFVVYPEGSEGREFTEATLRRVGVPLNTAAEASSASAMRSLVRAGVGAAFVPALQRHKRQRKKRALGDGCVSFDLTDMLREVAGLPKFGIFRRRVGTRRLIKEFCLAARKRLEK